MICFVVCLADTTGEYSVYTEYENNEIMFHVSTLLPFTPVNKQQVRERERETDRQKDRGNAPGCNC